MLVIFVVFLILNVHFWCKTEEVAPASLYKDYTTLYLKKLSKKENDCRMGYLHYIGPKEHEPCYDLTVERLRNMAAYTHQQAHADVKTDVKTYHEVGIKKLVKAVTTHLLMGKAAFVAQLCSPTTDKQRIKTIQEKQQFLEHNVSLHNNLKHILSQVKSGEHALLDLWNEQECADVNKTLQPYDTSHIPSVMQESDWARNVKVGVKALKPYMFPLCLTASIKLGGEWFKWYKNMPNGFQKESFDDMIEALPMVYNNIFAPFMRTYDHIFDDWIDVSIGIINTAVFIMAFNKGILDKKNSKEYTYVYYLPYAGYTIDIARNMYKIYGDRSDDAETAVHQTLIHVADYMRAAETIYKTMQHNADFNTHFPHFCSTYQTLRYSEKTKPLMDNLLETNTFTGSPSPFSNVGRIAVVSEQLMHLKQDIVPLMQAMGEIDQYLSLVDFKKNNSHEIPFIYTEMSEPKERAFVAGEHFVNPAFKESKPNTFSLGSDEPLTAIVTGPNGCGKSFAIAELVINALLSQTVGFVQAKKFDHVPLQEIVYIATPSGKIGGNSRYQAEVKTIGDVYDGNKKRAVAQETGLYIIDEPLTATNAQAGVAGVEEYIQRVDAIPDNNNLRIIITHHDIQKIGEVKHYQLNDGEEKFILKLGRSLYRNALKLVLEELDRRESNWQFLD